MDTTFNIADVVQSLKIKLANAEERSSQFEAVAISKDKKIKELEDKIKELEKGGDDN